MPPKTKPKKPLQGYSIRVTNTMTGEAQSQCVYLKTGTDVSKVLNKAVRGANK